MKSNVTLEELNAATVLLTGIPVSQLVEVHIAGSSVTAITADDEGNLIAARVAIGAPQEELAVDDPVVAEESEQQETEEVDEE